MTDQPSDSELELGGYGPVYGTPSDLGPEYWEHFLDDLEGPDPSKGPHLISAQELRASGALDVPESWRKSLSAGREPVQRDLFSDLDDDDDAAPEK